MEWPIRDSLEWGVEASIESAAKLEYSDPRSLESPFDLSGEYPLETKVTSELLLHAEQSLKRLDLSLD